MPALERFVQGDEAATRSRSPARVTPPMRKIIAISIAATMLSTGVIAQTTPSDPTRTQTPSEAKTLTSLPSPDVSISEIYNQSVYDSANNKIGEVQDILLSPDGRATALIIGVGGFLGIGEKEVAVPFNALKRTTKDSKAYLTLDASKDALKSAPGFKYDRQKSAWVPETQSNSYQPKNATVGAAVAFFVFAGTRDCLV